MLAGFPPKSEHVASISIAALVLDFMLLAMLFNIVIPVFEMPDEHLHYFYTQHLAQTGALPVQTGDYDTGGPWEQEGSQPPLYYFITAPLIRYAGAHLEAGDLWYNHQNTMGRPALAGNENRFVHPPEREGWPWQDYALAVHLARFLSTLFGAVTVVCVWLIARRVLPGRDWLALAAAALVAFNPQFIATSATMSNDGVVIMLSAVALALVLRIADGDGGDHSIPLLAIVVGLAPLAKLSGIALVGFTLLTLALLAWRRRDWRFFVTTAGPVLLAVALLAGWWYLRNLQLYGDITGISHMLPESMDRNFRLDTWLAGLPAELRGAWWSAWGIFGWFTILLPTGIYTVLSALALLALLGLAFAAWRRAAWIDWPRLLWLAAWGAVVLASLLRWLTIAKGGHGRLLFPAIATLAVALVAGWRALIDVLPEPRGSEGESPEPASPLRIDRVLAITITLAMFSLTIYSLLGVIAPAFAMPRTISADAIPADAVPANVVFGEGLRLLAVQRPDRVTAGTEFPVTLYWQADQPIERDGFVALRVDQNDVRWTHRRIFERHAEPVSSPGDTHLSYPGQGNAPPELLPGGPAIVVDRHVLTAPELVTGDQPLAARLSVHVYDQAKEERWPMVEAGAAGDPAVGDPESEWFTDIPIAPIDPLRFKDYEVIGVPGPHARFDNGLQLYRYRGTGDSEHYNSPGFATYDPETVKLANPGDEITTGLGWHAERDLAEPLSLFVHLVDAGTGETVATFDSPPATYAPFPTTFWRAGDDLYAPVTWTVPNDAPPGARYRLVAGLYRPADGARIPVADPSGQRFEDDAVPLLAIEIAPR
jgi:hypothetical protein